MLLLLCGSGGSDDDVVINTSVILKHRFPLTILSIRSSSQLLFRTDIMRPDEAKKDNSNILLLLIYIPLHTIIWYSLYPNIYQMIYYVYKLTTPTSHQLHRYPLDCISVYVH